MKFLFHGLSLVALALALTSCPNSGGPGGGAVGPYDAQGNYVEAWADDPSKWRHPARDVAKNDLPPPDVTPLPSSGSKPEILLPPTRPTTPDRTIASNSTSTPKPTATRTTSTRPTATRTTSSRPTSTASRSTTSKKPTVAKTTKPKPKPKPAVAKTTRHTVRKGDTLSGLAAKYGTSVSAIQKANGISGTMIRDGKSLVIPRKR